MTQIANTRDNPEDCLELERLRALEAASDPARQRFILSTRLTKGWRCLEVGAGAGSLLSWMASVVGPMGSTTAIDLYTRYLSNPTSRGHVIKGDIRTEALTSEWFDLFHARYVLVHIPDYEVALARLVKVLRPGGWLVLEEPVSSAARPISGPEGQMASVERKNAAIRNILTNTSKDYELGVRLPGLVQAAKLRNMRVEHDAPISYGRSAIAEMMKMCAVQSGQQYIDTGEATEQDVENYCRFAEDPQSWAIYYATVRVVGQK